MRARSRSTSRSWTPRLPRSSARAPSRSATRRPCGRREMPWSRGSGPEGWRRRRHAPCRRPSWAPTPMAQSMFRPLGEGPCAFRGPSGLLIALTADDRVAAYSVDFPPGRHKDAPACLTDMPPCPHGRQRSKCKECGGCGICEHGRQRSQCKDCGGGGICEHGRRRHLCKECGGSSICEHGRQRYGCKECGGGGIASTGGGAPSARSAAAAASASTGGSAAGARSAAAAAP